MGILFPVVKKRKTIRHISTASRSPKRKGQNGGIVVNAETRLPMSQVKVAQGYGQKADCKLAKLERVADNAIFLEGYPCSRFQRL